MKQYLSILFVSLCLNVFSQFTYYRNLDFNDVSCRISANGIFFKDVENSLGNYFVPKWTGINAIYQMSISASAKNTLNEDLLSVTTYDSSDFTCGPLATDYNDSNYIQKYRNHIWVAYKAYIDYHIQHWSDTDYVIDPSIVEWPGNGDVSNGMANQLAPYADVNGNNTYDPQNGDYPVIPGDIAMFMIMNDQNNQSFPNNLPLNTELHFMFYSFVREGLETTTFLNIRAYNRGNEPLSDFRLNVFSDFDLGNYADDFSGTDISRNLAYVYNGDSFDDDYAGRPGYGSNPPAIGMLSLNHNLETSIFPDSVPLSGTDFQHIISGKQVDGTPILNNSTPVVFQYTDTSSTGYNEFALNNAPGDRRSFATINAGDFAPNEVKCFDFAFVFANKNNGDYWQDVDSLFQLVDFVQNYYDTTNRCEDGFLAVTSITKPNNLLLYPNPVNNKLTCKSAEVLHGIEIWSMDGRKVKSIPDSGTEISIDVNDLQPGTYLLKASGEQNQDVQTFLKL